MRRRIRPGLLVAAAGLVGASGCATPGAGSPPVEARLPLADRVEAVVSRPPLDGVHWGLLLVDPSDGRVLHERNAHLRFVPASNMKIPVTLGAMALLGPEYTWETAFYAAQPPTGGVVDGDLVLAAAGDPSLGEPFHDSVDDALEALADRLLDAGVRRVAGALVVDVAAWDSTTVPSSWTVGNLPARYASTGAAFTVGRGELELELTGAERPGEPARVAWRPMGSEGFVENHVTTVEAGGPVELRHHYLPESRRWVVEGTVPVGARRTASLAQRDPVRQGSHALLRAVEGRGIRVDGGVRIAWDRSEALVHGCAAGRIPDCPPAVRVARLASPPLREVVRAILEPSQNWMTEQLVRTLGAELGEDGSWRGGFEVLGRFLVEEVGVDSLDVHFRDGSGLSSYNLVSPRALIRMLDYARDQPWAADYRAAMAEPGEVDTTLERRLEDLRGRVFAKTGTISHVNSLSGYLLTDDGRELLFSILTNASNLPAAEIRNAIDEVLREFARPRDLQPSMP